MHLLIYIDIALFIFIAFFIGYDLFFTLASFFRRRHRKHRSIRLQKFAVIFAAYKEDQVIQESVERILLQDYPADKYRVIVVSDHMREETNQALAKLPIELLTPDFEHSMKHKSITYALEYLKEGIDKVVILDADNLTDTDFLTRINDITQDNIALQAHPYPQERQYADSGMGRYLRGDQQHHLPQGAGQCRDLLLLDRLRHGIRLRMAEIPHAPMRHFRRGQGAGDLSRHGKYLC